MGPAAIARSSLVSRRPQSDNPASPRLFPNSVRRVLMSHSCMRKRKTVLLLATCLAVAATLVALLCRDPGPRYQGRPIDEWLEPLGGNARQHTTGGIGYADAHTAVKEIGTNAIPILLKWIAYKPNPSKSKQTISKLLSILPPRARPQRVVGWLYAKDPEQIRIDAALAAFALLGSDACSAAPGLARIATVSADQGPAERAVDALVGIGPLGLPALLGVITNRNAQARYYATASIRKLGKDATPAVPTIIPYLTDLAIAAAAFETLAHLRLESELVVPSLTSITHSNDPVLRSWALLTLADFGQEARSATPAILAACSDSSAVVRESATNALLIIAPQLLTNAPPW